MAVSGKTGKKHKRRGFYDYNLLAVVIILICFGLVMLYSASSYEGFTNFNGDDMYFLKKQAIFSIIAVVIAIFISKINYEFICKFAVPIYVIAIAAMFAVKFTSLGMTINGARRWLGFAGFSIQPSEAAKIAVILITSTFIVRLGRDFYSLWGALKTLSFGIIADACAWLLTDNLSTAIIIFCISMFMIFIAHPAKKPFIVIWIIAAVLIIAAVIYMSKYMEASEGFRIQRVLVWLNPEQHSDEGGYQVLQGLYAIGSGGFFGKGFGNSTQKISTIPEAQNDMIFSIVCEELGLVGAIILLLLFAYLLYRIVFIAQNAPELKGCLIASGVFIHISLQVILNICVVLNLIPTTGITLPFVSYGGTSVVFLMIEIGIVLGISSKIEMRPKVVKSKKTIRVKKNIRNTEIHG